MSALDYIRLIVAVLMLSTGIGLMFVALVAPRRTTTNYYFSIFSAVLAAFAMTVLLRTVQGGIPPLSPLMVIQLLTFFLIFLVVSYYAFVIHYLDERAPIVRWSIIALLIFAVLTAVLAWNGSLFTSISADGMQFSLSPVGYAMVGMAVLYGALASFIVWRSPQGSARWLRIPGIAIMLGYVSSALAPDLPFDLMLFTLAGLWAASALVRQQIFTPMASLNEELSTRNADLQETVGQLEQEKSRVEHLNRELVDAYRYKTEFLTNMSHELRTPLNAIIGYSELLDSPVYGELNKQQADRLQRIHRNGKHLLKMIDTILDMSNLESGDLAVGSKPVRLGSVVSRVVDRYQPQSNRKALQLSYDVPATLPAVPGDEQRIEQVVSNLVENAIKFTSEGAIMLTGKQLVVADGHTDEFDLPMYGWLADGEWVLLAVQDTGIGIAGEDLSRIFVNFAQLDGSPSREQGGIGLGLSLAKQIVELHRGMIWVESQPGAGSTFYVALPVNVPA